MLNVVIYRNSVKYRLSEFKSSYSGAKAPKQRLREQQAALSIRREIIISWPANLSSS